MIIYKTTNLINGKFYIGQDSNNNPSYLGSGILLKKAIKKYGKENFQKESLCKCLNKQELNQQEVYWIEQLKPHYNIAKGGAGGSIIEMLPNAKEIYQRRKNSIIEAYRRKGSYSLNLTASQRETISKRMINHKKSDITIEKMRQAFAGRIFSDDHKHKISISSSKENNAFYGKTLEKKHKQKISKTLANSKRTGNIKTINISKVDIWSQRLVVVLYSKEYLKVKDIRYITKLSRAMIATILFQHNIKKTLNGSDRINFYR